MTPHGEMDATPLFTVIIPNKNRAAYLAHTLRTCSMQGYDRLEIIVSDDASTENTREVVEDAASRDPRIRFISHVPGLGMRDNFEFALRQAKPGYVIALGGDDGLLPGGISGMRDVLQETGMELLAWPAPLFTYPTVRGSTGQLALFRRSGTRVIESAEFLARQARHLHYLGDLESPMFYVKGVASTRLIERVRQRTPDGRFYSCPTPDGYSGIVLAGETPRYAFSGRPFSIYGLSPESQGLAYLSNDEKAKASSAQFVRTVAARPMHAELASQPYSPLITLMTVDYLLTCRDLPGWGGKVPAIDYRQVLRNSLKELAHGLYGEDRVCRELLILRQIAHHHGLSDYFSELVRRTRRRATRTPFDGSGVNANAFFFDARVYDLHNIVDAAFAAKYLHQAFEDLRPASALALLTRSIKYRLASLGRGASFPPESEWEQSGGAPNR